MTSFKIQPIRAKANDTILHENLPFHPSLVAIVAPRKSGKTTLLVNMLTREDMYKKFFHEIHIWSPTIKLDAKWEHVTKYLPKEWIHTHFDEIEFLHLMEDIQMRIEGKPDKKEIEKEKQKKHNPVLVRSEKQMRRIEKEIEEEKEKQQKKKKPSRVLFVFDDSASEKGLFGRNNFTSPAVKAAFTSRHYGVSMWIVSQSYKAISTGFRNNIHHWILFDVSNDKERERMAEELSGPLSPYGFLKLLQDVTSEPYQFLYVNFEADKRDEYFRKGFSPPLDISAYKLIRKKPDMFDMEDEQNKRKRQELEENVSEAEKEDV